MSIVLTNQQNLESALEIAALGFRVFPVHGLINGTCTCCKSPCPNNSRPGKHPACPHGYKDATIDKATIEAWFKGKSYLNLAIAPDADVLGLDIDIKAGGKQSLEDWEKQFGPLPLTPRVKTGTGGDHYYFRLPEGVSVRNTASISAPGIDLRTLGGYLIAPPSLHQSGGTYEWIVPLSTPLAQAPDWLLKLVADKPNSKPEVKGQSQGLSLVVKDTGPCDFPSHPGSPEGQRNHELCRLTGVHLSRGDSLATIEGLALAWAKRCSPPCEEQGVLAKVRALAKKEQAKALGNAGMEDKKGEIPLSSIPCQVPEHEQEGKIPNSFPPSPSLSNPDLYLTKKYLEISPTGNTPGGGREDCAYSSEATSQVRELEPLPLAFGLCSEASESGTDRRGEEGLGEADASGLGPLATGPNSEPPARSDWPWLGREAYHGLFGEIVQAIAPETEADPAAILLSLLTAFGSAVGKGPSFALASGSHHANIFTAIVGDTASGKGQSWGVIHKLMRQADPEWEACSIAYGMSSGEGLVDRLKDDADAEDQAFFGAIPNAKSLLALETEFARPITAMRREGNTLSPLLRSAWDGQTLEVLTRGKSKLRASNAHVSIISHVTPEELEKLLKQSVEVANGFSNRFLWALAKRSNVLPEGGNPDALDRFARPLRQAIQRAREIGRLERSPEAKELWAKVYGKLTEPRPGAYGQAVGRGHAQTLRLSLLYALSDGSSVIKEEHLKAALAVWAYCEASAKKIFQAPIVAQAEGGREAREEPLDLKLFEMIQTEPGITRSALTQAIASSHRSSVGPALESLQARGLAHAQTVATGGRSAEGWFPGPSPGPEPESQATGLSFVVVDDDGEIQEIRNGMEDKGQTPEPDLPSIPFQESQACDQACNPIPPSPSLSYPNSPEDWLSPDDWEKEWDKEFGHYSEEGVVR